VPSWPPRTEPAGADRLRPIQADEHGEGPSAILLHGQPGDRHDWDGVVSSLADRCRVLVPDRPGYGATGGPAGGPAANADAVAALLDLRGLERVTVVGHSWGGAIALELALRHPARVRALVLVSSVGGDGSLGTLDRLLGAPVLGPLLAVGGLALMRPSRVRRLLAAGYAPAHPWAMDVLPTRWMSSWPSFVAEQRALLEELPGITARLGQVDVPAVVLIGESDRIVRPSSQAALAGRLPGARTRRLPGCGHLLPREAPDAIADAIIGASAAVP
jgi:3-oxoadipate enol-lactonase